jgi:hypothetical protein
MRVACCHWNCTLFVRAAQMNVSAWHGRASHGLFLPRAPAPHAVRRWRLGIARRPALGASASLAVRRSAYSVGNRPSWPQRRGFAPRRLHGLAFLAPRWRGFAGTAFMPWTFLARRRAASPRAAPLRPAPPPLPMAARPANGAAARRCAGKATHSSSGSKPCGVVSPPRGYTRGAGTRAARRAARPARGGERRSTQCGSDHAQSTGGMPRGVWRRQATTPRR